MITSLAIHEPTTRDAAVRYLVDHASRRGFAIAVDLLGDRGEAEDAVQEALLRTLAGVHRLRDPGALEGWFFRVLANTCVGVLRRRRVASAFARLLGRTEPAQPPVEGGDHARMLRELDHLPAMQKAALVLRYGHDLPLEEIAAILDVGTETVKTHLKRGRARLRDRLGVNHDER
ncbi:MAG: sigma-70 family RNA polymerase sigma factor [Deltaproteobacteria bacterium]|nr:sigma-70 family RNA polymerase sigma factor [Deltaproteobacteria bacterium]